MTVAELRKALEGLPDDMVVRPQGTTVGTRIRVTVNRWHFAWREPEDAVRICSATLPLDDNSSGYHPECQAVLYEDPVDRYLYRP